MTLACIEHVNVTVENPDQVAQLFIDLFDWEIRWSGESKDNGYTVHVGTQKRYFALYAHPKGNSQGHSFKRHGTLNHVGLVVLDLEQMEEKVKALGLTPESHSNYGPCRSFYFMAEPCLEIEVVCYKES